MRILSRVKGKKKENIAADKPLWSILYEASYMKEHGVPHLYPPWKAVFGVEEVVRATKMFWPPLLSDTCTALANQSYPSH
jgi:hypothetical protein